MKTQVGIPESETLDSRQQGVSRRNFLKVGVSSFLGLIAMQASAIISVDTARGNCRPCQTLHRPIHEWRRESIGHL